MKTNLEYVTQDIDHLIQFVIDFKRNDFCEICSNERTNSFDCDLDLTCSILLERWLKQKRKEVKNDYRTITANQEEINIDSPFD